MRYLRDWPIRFKQGDKPCIDWWAEADQNGNTLIHFVRRAEVETAAGFNPLFSTKIYSGFVGVRSYEELTLDIKYADFEIYTEDCKASDRVMDISETVLALIAKQPQRSLELASSLVQGALCFG